MAVATKDAIHRLVERLPEGELHTAFRFLEYLVRQVDAADAMAFHETTSVTGIDRTDDLVLRAFQGAPEDDEVWTAEELAGIDEAKAEVARGDLVPWGEAKARLLGSA